MVQRTTNPTQPSNQQAPQPLLINYSLISENGSNDQQILDHVRQGSREAYSYSSTFYILPMIPSSITGRPFSLLPPSSLPPPLSCRSPQPFLPPSSCFLSITKNKIKPALQKKKKSKRKQALTDEKHHLPLTAPLSSLASPSQRGK